MLTDLDLMTRVTTGHLPVDAPLLHLLGDLRATDQRLHDDVWLRLLNVPAALSARTYQADVDVVIAVRDTLLPTSDGHWRLRGGPGGAHVTPADEPADLALDVAELGRAYLGGVSLAGLGAAGLVEERTPGSLMTTSTAFGWPVASATIWPF